MARITRTGSRGASAPRIVRRAEARRPQASEPAGGSAVLLSGGLDSVVLLAAERRDHGLVWPIHVRSGLALEEAEARTIAALLAGPPFAGRIQPLTTIGLDMRDVYAETHWARTGRAPAYDTPDEAVYIEGRNLVLIAKAAVLCAET
jgi:7-cyano-7-deazaguanine synthase